MARKVNPIQAKNRAICVTYSWLRSWGIDVRAPKDGEEGDLIVGGKVIVIQEDSAPGNFDFSLSSSAILGSNLDDTLAELHKLTEFLGLGSPEGFRKVTSTRANTHDYLGVSMRLTPFSRTPNLPTSDIRKWMPVLMKEVNRAFRRCEGILYNMGLEKKDLVTVGLVYLTNYLNRHQLLKDEKITGANLTLSLRQQFGRWAGVTIKHLRGVAPITSGMPIDFVMGSPCPNSRFVKSPGEDCATSYEFNLESLESPEEEPEPQFDSEEVKQKWFHKKEVKDNRYYTNRRRNAKIALEQALSDMPHDKMLSVLNEVKNSEFQHPDARAEAKRRIAAHQKTCSSCKSTCSARSVNS